MASTQIEKLKCRFHESKCDHRINHSDEDARPAMVKRDGRLVRGPPL